MLAAGATCELQCQCRGLNRRYGEGQVLPFPCRFYKTALNQESSPGEKQPTSCSWIYYLIILCHLLSHCVSSRSTKSHNDQNKSQETAVICTLKGCVAPKRISSRGCTFTLIPTGILPNPRFTHQRRSEPVPGLYVIVFFFQVWLHRAQSMAHTLCTVTCE